MSTIKVTQDSWKVSRDAVPEGYEQYTVYSEVDSMAVQS